MQDALAVAQRVNAAGLCRTTPGGKNNARTPVPRCSGGVASGDTSVSAEDRQLLGGGCVVSYD